MDKVLKRINGLLHIAQKREQSGSEVDKLIGRQVTRNLKMIKRILEEEVVRCEQCRDYASPEDAASCGYICSGVAELLESRGEGYCTYKNRNDIVPLDGYCHRGERPCGEI